LNDIREWLSITRWSQKQISKESLDKVKSTLQELKLIDISLTTEQLLYTAV